MKQEISHVKILDASSFKLEDNVKILTNKINLEIETLKNKGYTIVDVTVQSPVFTDTSMSQRYFQTATISYTEREEILEK